MSDNRIVLPAAGRETIEVYDEGTDTRHEFAINVDDTRIASVFMEQYAELTALEARYAETTDNLERARMMDETWDAVVRCIDLILGDGACATIFGEAHSLYAAGILVNELAERIAPKTRELFAGYEPSKVE